MILKHADLADKGWYIGPWDSDLAIGVGYANKGIDDPQVHQQITEIYLVARGTAQIRIEQHTIQLQPGDIVIVEPGEAHTHLSHSPDYFHFVIQTAGAASAFPRHEKQPVTRAHLGLPDSPEPA